MTAARFTLITRRLELDGSPMSLTDGEAAVATALLLAATRGEPFNPDPLIEAFGLQRTPTVGRISKVMEAAGYHLPRPGPGRPRRAAPAPGAVEIRRSDLPDHPLGADDIDLIAFTNLSTQVRRTAEAAHSSRAWEQVVNLTGQAISLWCTGRDPVNDQMWAFSPVGCVGLANRLSSFDNLIRDTEAELHRVAEIEIEACLHLHRFREARGRLGTLPRRHNERRCAHCRELAARIDDRLGPPDHLVVGTWSGWYGTRLVVHGHVREEVRLGHPIESGRPGPDGHSDGLDETFSVLADRLDQHASLVMWISSVNQSVAQRRTLLANLHDMLMGLGVNAMVGAGNEADSLLLAEPLEGDGVVGVCGGATRVAARWQDPEGPAGWGSVLLGDGDWLVDGHGSAMSIATDALRRAWRFRSERRVWEAIPASRRPEHLPGLGDSAHKAYRSPHGNRRARDLDELAALADGFYPGLGEEEVTRWLAGSGSAPFAMRRVAAFAIPVCSAADRGNTEAQHIVVRHAADFARLLLLALTSHPAPAPETRIQGHLTYSCDTYWRAVMSHISQTTLPGKDVDAIRAAMNSNRINSGELVALQLAHNLRRDDLPDYRGLGIDVISSVGR